MEVDYTEKLNFSDDEENQAAKDKGENWLAFLYIHVLFLIYYILLLLFVFFTCTTQVFPSIGKISTELVQSSINL